MLHPNQTLVIFDGDCGICSASTRWLTRLDWRHRLACLPAQAAGLREVVGLSRADTDAAAWAVLPDGSKRRGAAVIAVAVDQLLPAGVPLFSALCRVPVLRQLADLLYVWVAANRHRIPGAPACGIGRRVPALAADDAAEIARRMGGPGITMAS